MKLLVASLGTVTCLLLVSPFYSNDSSILLRFGKYSYLLILIAIAVCQCATPSSARSQHVIPLGKMTYHAPDSNQFPLRLLWDDALRLAVKKRENAIMFDLDYVDSNSKKFRDSVLSDPTVQSFLSKHFIIGYVDFSVDPPPTVGFDSLRVLGQRLSGLEDNYRIVVRPTAILLRPDGTEIDRISFVQTLTAPEFTHRVQEILDGRNTLRSYIETFWNDTTAVLTRLALLDQFEHRSLYDSVLAHLRVLSSYPGSAKLAREAALKYSYMRLDVEGKSGALREFMATLQPSGQDSVLYVNGLFDLLSLYRRKKNMDSIAVFYNRIFAYTRERDPDLVNNFAWDLGTYSKKWDTALVLINEAIMARPRQAEYYDTKALIDFNLHNNDDVITDEDKAIEFAPAEDKQNYEDLLKAYKSRMAGKDVLHSPDPNAGGNAPAKP